MRFVFFSLALLLAVPAHAGWYAVAGWQPLSDAGALLASGTLTFSRTGTSTAKNIYSDKALSNALSNPLTLDAAGRVTTNVWMLEDECYRVVLKNSAGTTIWTRDEQCALSPSVDEATKRKSVIRSPMDYGAAGDGVTNDNTAIAAALSAISTAGGGVLDLDGNSYVSNSALTMVSNLTIRNGTLDFSANASGGIVCQGTTTNSTGVASLGTQSITPDSTSGYSATDLVRIRSTDTIATGHRYSELFRVEQVSGGAVVVDGVILGTYTSSVVLEEVTPISDVRLEDLTIKAPSGVYAVDVDLCARFRMRNVRIESTAAAEGVSFTNAYDVVIDSSTWAPKTSSEGGGLIIGDASRDVLVTGSRIERALQAIEIGADYGTHDGLTRNVRIAGTSCMWCGGVVLDAGARYVDIDANHFELDILPSTTTYAGILIGGVDVKIRNNTIRYPDGTNREAIDINTGSGGEIIISGNHILNIAGALNGVGVRMSAGTLSSLQILDNTIEVYNSERQINLAAGDITAIRVERNTLRGNGTGIDATFTGTFTTMSVSENVIASSVASTVIDVSTSLASTAHARISVERNRVIMTSAGTATGIALDVNEAAYLSVVGNTVTGDGGTGNGPGVGIALASAATVSNLINGNTVELARGAGATACITALGSYVTISNNSLVSQGSTGSGIDYTESAGASFLVVSGNFVRTDSVGIDVETSSASDLSYVTISGNSVIQTAATTAASVRIVGGGTGSVVAHVAVSGNVITRGDDSGVGMLVDETDAIVISGNSFVNGTYGIDIDANSTEAVLGENVFSGQATGETTGTFDAIGVPEIYNPLGWVPASSANQACNTTCTSPCVFGMNTGALGNFLACSDATADTCVCAGP